MAAVALPRIAPAIPTLVREPFHRPGWVFEEKVDGWQILAYPLVNLSASVVTGGGF